MEAVREKYCGGAWTKARWMSFVKGALRAASSRYPPKYTCLKAAATTKKINWKTGRVAQHYKCNSCENEFPAKDVQVDHISPIVNPLTGFTTWDEIVNNMFCEESNLQVLCKDCHTIKSNAEKRQAKENKNK